MKRSKAGQRSSVRAFFTHPRRVAGRLIWLMAELALAGVNYGRWCVLGSNRLTAAARAAWLQCSARRMLRCLGIRVEAREPAPSSGLLVCNHLSYLDVLVLAALTPVLFVAKSEVRGWPILGWFARLGGTIFVQRDRRSPAVQSAQQI